MNEEIISKALGGMFDKYGNIRFTEDVDTLGHCMKSFIEAQKMSCPCNCRKRCPCSDVRKVSESQIDSCGCGLFVRKE